MEFKRFLVAACTVAGIAMSGGAGEAQDLKLHTDADLWRMVTVIAPSASKMNVNGAIGTRERALTIARDAGEPVVTSIQVVPNGSAPQVAPGTLVLVIVHAPGECASPYQMDDALAANSLETFVVSAAGDEIWEVAKVDAGVSVRRVQGSAGPGAWEPFRKSPADYTLYRCAR